MQTKCFMELLPQRDWRVSAHGISMMSKKDQVLQNPAILFLALQLDPLFNYQCSCQATLWGCFKPLFEGMHLLSNTKGYQIQKLEILLTYENIKQITRNCVSVLTASAQTALLMFAWYIRASHDVYIALTFLTCFRISPISVSPMNACSWGGIQILSEETLQTLMYS